jgi:aromatic-L-amino-acid/L-tryptophan decarboxylase
MGRIITSSCLLAQELQLLISNESTLEILGPAAVTLNIICFRFIGNTTTEETILNRYADATPHCNLTQSSDITLPRRVNRSIVLELHSRGRVAPSITSLAGKVAIRAALFNHRSTQEDIVCLVSSVLEIGRHHLAQSLTEESVKTNASAGAEGS